jgi:proteasome lid subunit RPN8/RPN11
MSRKHKDRPATDRTPSPAEAKNVPAAADQKEDGVSVGQWRAERSAVWRTFPGPRGVDVPLRVACERGAYAEVVAHAKESLDAEICGVLVGTECRDDDGPFVHVEAAVRGTRAQEGTAHVTYTQETWNAIYATLDRDYPKLQIVGWYHSHPGFGVEFSDMDIFIQKNFFSGPTQFGLVTDPLGGEMAICANADDGIRYVNRCWVDGREQKCRVPQSRGGTSTVDGSATSATVQSLETRVTQLVQTIDEMRQSFYRWLTGVGMLAATVIIFFVIWSVVQMLFPRIPEPPKGMSFQWVPVTIEGKPSLVGIQFVKWELPPDLVTSFTQLEAEQKAAAEAKKAKAEEDAKRDSKDAGTGSKPGEKRAEGPAKKPDNTPSKQGK